MKSWTWQRRRIVHAAALHVAALSLVGAQPSRQPENNTGDQCSPLMVLIIVVFFIAAFFFMGFFSIYIHQCSNSQPYRRAAAARGLNPSVIETFPTLSYSEVKDQCRALECTVCLNEFEVNETLRLLPKCDHIFHPECVGAWLKFHVTCPVCRANLDPLAGHEPVRATQPWHTNDVESELGFQGPESGR